ncbi:Transcriptional regulator, XRE family [Candidatus Burkholderia brachyanthoides]|nr:Transcriptional regulator, XRE family [Candidatus Burkholderia brachyanthoides]
METDDAGAQRLLQRIGAAIAVARKRAGYTQAVVARAIGVEKETVSRLETGAMAPTVFRLSQFADLYQCPISALFGEHQASAGEDARAVSALIADLQKENRQLIMRLVSDIASVVREEEAWRHRFLALEREVLLAETRGDHKKRRPRRL